MAFVTPQELQDHLNGVPEHEDHLARLLAASEAHLSRLLGFKADDALLYPDGPPEDLKLAVLMLAGHFYENREATLVGVSAEVLPLGFLDIVREHRNYTFG
ncbi:MAG TPA: head-tail connector protein, partial [Tianweitania sediminis]|nr:head-tail connector protein [Tianweitania sediminis]